MLFAWHALSSFALFRVVDAEVCEEWVANYRQRVRISQLQLAESERLANSIFTSLRQAMELDFNYLYMAANFAMSIPKASLTGEAFREFTRPLADGGLWNPSMQGVSFNPRVQHNNTDPSWASINFNRSDWEVDGAAFWEPQSDYTTLHRNIRGDGNFTFTIKAPGFLPRPDAEEYYIVQYITPNAGNVAAAGYDIGSDPVRLMAIKAAERNQARVVTGRLRLVQSVWEQYGFLMLFPLFHDVSNTNFFTMPGRSRTAYDGSLLAPIDNADLRPVGFVVGVYKMEEMVGQKLEERFGSQDVFSIAKSLLVLVFSQIGYDDGTGEENSWQYLAGFVRTQTTVNDRSDTATIEQFNLDWRAREQQMLIVANELFCDEIVVDDVGSKWLIVVALDFGCPMDSYTAQPPVPGKNLTRCTGCPANSGTFTIGSDSIDDCICTRGYFWDASASTCLECELGTFGNRSGMYSVCVPCPAHSSTLSPASVAARDCVCFAGYERAVDGSCAPCPALFSSELGGQCKLRVDHVIGIAAVVLFLGLALLVARWVRRQLAYRKKMEQEKEQVAQEKLVAGLKYVTEVGHPMVLMSAHIFEKLPKEELYLLHEGNRDAGRLCVLDSVDAIESFKAAGNNIMLYSYQWLSWDRSGPDDIQREAMIEAIDKICAAKDILKDTLYIWLDIISIPQVHNGLKAMAVDSLYVYAGLADMVVIIAPPSVHANTGDEGDVESYKRRVWTRAEQIAHTSRVGFSTLYIYTRRDFCKVPDGWINDAIRIFDGEMTCCRRQHPGNTRCDRESLVPVVLGLYFDLYVKSKHNLLSDEAAEMWSLISSNVNDVLPPTFQYRAMKGCYDKPLFGDMVARVERFADMNTEAALKLCSYQVTGDRKPIRMATSSQSLAVVP